MPTVGSRFKSATLLPEVADFTFCLAAENLAKPGTPAGVEHYVGRAGPDPGYVNLPPSTVGIGGPLISLKKADPLAIHVSLRLPGTAGRQ
jgi:hypothetical protein